MIRKIRFSKGGKTEIASCSFDVPTKRYVSDSKKIRFFRTPKRQMSHQCRFSAMKKLILSDSENQLFQSVITFKILFRLLWGNEKPISFEFGIFAFSGLQYATNRVKVFLALRKSDFFSDQENSLFQGSKRYKSCQGYLALRKIHFFRIRKKCLGTI